MKDSVISNGGKWEVEPIEPLIKTHWHQTDPYNRLLDRKYGICTLIAFCQLLHYFKVPQTYNDIFVNDTLTLPVTTFNHDIILPSYNDDNRYSESADEVAKLFYYYYEGCGGYEDKFKDNFGVELSFVAGGWTEKNYWEYFDECLENGMPFEASGCAYGVGHAFIVDGRASDRTYHINLGWGGEGDGYYVLPNNCNNLCDYNGDDEVLTYASCVWMGYTLVPQNYSWNYTSDIVNTNIQTKHNRGNVYNLQGIKVGNSLEGLPKGIYIQGGKKYFVK
jgi:hypothetical protein